MPASFSSPKAGHFYLKGKHVTPQDVRAFAARLDARASARMNSLQPISPRAQALPPRAQAPPAAQVFQSAPLTITRTITPSQKADTMPDILRGMNEADVRTDMRIIVKEQGGNARAAIATGMAKSSWGNSLYGMKKIGAAVMLALYGPRGTTLRPEIRKATVPQIPADDAAAAAGGPPPPVEQHHVSAEASKAEQEQNHETPAAAALEPRGPGEQTAAAAAEAGGDAGSDLVATPPGHQEPVAPPAELAARLSPGIGPEDATAGQTAEAPWGGRVLPPWLAKTLENLIDEELKIGEQVAQLTAQLAKIAKARELLRELAG